jgi:hypothetical protein
MRAQPALCASKWLRFLNRPLFHTGFQHIKKRKGALCWLSSFSFFFLSFFFLKETGSAMVAVFFFFFFPFFFFPKRDRERYGGCLKCQPGVFKALLRLY